MKEPFIRYETLAGVEYEMLSSDQETYYTVPLLDGKALGCQCRFARFNPSCKHQQEAERVERVYQGLPEKEPGSVAVKGSLNNSNKGFSVLR